jgi:hypothetical protein
MRRRLAPALCFLLFFSVSAAPQNQKPKPAPAPTGKQKSPSSFIDRVLKYLGISDSPGTLKGPGDEAVAGELWVADLSTPVTHAVAAAGRYRSPVFVPGSNEILALSATDLLRFSLTSKEPKKLYTIEGVNKLIGFSADDPDNLLILRSEDASGHPRVGLLSLSSAKITPLAYDPASSTDLQMVENLEGWTRTYGDKLIFVRRQTKQALSGTVEWSDVFLKADDQEPINVSRCNGANCGQPSLSADGRLLVFVKSEPE